MLRTTLYSVAFLAVLTVVPGMAEQCFAADVGFSVDRAVLDYGLLPGTSKDDIIKIVNQSRSQPVPLAVSFLLADTSDDSEEIEYLETEPEVNPLTWIHASTTEFILQPGEERRLYFSLRIPYLAPPGSYLVMIKFSTFFPNTSGATGVLEMPEVRIPLLIKVSGLNLEGTGDIYAAELSALAVQPANGTRISLWDNVIQKTEAAVMNSVPSEYSVTVKNSGIYHFKSAGTLLVKNIFGQTVQKISLPERYLLPGKSRTFALSLKGAGEQAAHFDTASVSGGRYTLELFLENPNLSRPGYLINKQFALWVLPWQKWLAVLIAALLVVLMLSRLRGRIGPALRALEGRES